MKPEAGTAPDESRARERLRGGGKSIDKNTNRAAEEGDSRATVGNVSWPFCTARAALHFSQVGFGRSWSRFQRSVSTLELVACNAKERERERAVQGECI